MTLPGVEIGAENPLPVLHTPGNTHSVDGGGRDLPIEMAGQIGRAPLRSLLPCRMVDTYGRDRAPRERAVIVVENEQIRAMVIPGLGGRLYSLVHKPSGRELLYRNPVFQPANFALNGAWFSGGVEWNIGATGHTTLTCAPVHAARVPAPDGGEMLRLWEWERLRDLPYQIDLWLPERSAFLYVGVRIRNPHQNEVPTYWWSNIAVPQQPQTRVLAPADEAWHFGYSRTLHRVPIPEWNGLDRSYPARAQHAADYFFELPEAERRWIAALDAHGQGLVQTSTDLLRGRKLFLWGSGRGGQRWQDWLTEPGTGGYLEIQAGLARTQLEHVPLMPQGQYSWMEGYGAMDADPAAVHSSNWQLACGEVARRLESTLPRAELERAYETWLPFADRAPTEVLSIGSGWGGVEVAHGKFDLPGTPFGPAELGPEVFGSEQRPWLDLSGVGSMREARPEEPPGSSLVAPHWRELLEFAHPTWLTEYHLGVAQWHWGDRAQAVRAWERSLDCAESPWALRCLAIAELISGEPGRAAKRLLDALDLIDRGAYRAAVGTPSSAALAALARETVEALLAAGRAGDARQVLDRLPEGIRRRGRFLLLHARVLLAAGDVMAAREVFDTGFEVEDLREGDESLEATWYAIAESLIAEGDQSTDEVIARARTEHPLPHRYDFRMGARPSEVPCQEISGARPI